MANNEPADVHESLHDQPKHPSTNILANLDRISKQAQDQFASEAVIKRDYSDKKLEYELKMRDAKKLFDALGYISKDQ